MKPLANMGSNYSPAAQGKETSWMDALEGIPYPGGTTADRPPAQRSLSSRDLTWMEKGGALLLFHLLKSRDWVIKILSMSSSFAWAFVASSPTKLPQERVGTGAAVGIPQAYKAHFFSSLSYAFLPHPPSQLHHNHSTPTVQAKLPSKGLLSHNFLTVTVALGYGEPSSPFDTVPWAKE